jgi:outer membrane protein assembly factor BamB
VRWKVAVPGKGLASPVIWGDRIFLTTAVPTGKKVELEVPENETERERAWRLRGIQPEMVQRYTVMALDRATGKVLWEDAPVEELPHEGTHGDGSWASASPVTDGEHLIVSFGSRGVFGYTLDGKKLWSKDLGDMETRNGFGEGSSPALHGDTVVINWDHEGEDFIVALDKATGEERWRKQRDEPTSWSTPLVVEHGGRAQVVVAATEATRAYDLKTGDVLWEVPGMTVNTIPTPVEQDGVVFVMSGFRGNLAQAIRLGDVVKKAESSEGAASEDGRVLWSLDRDTPYVPSPVLYQGTLYFLKSNNGIVTAVNAASGEVLYGPERLPGISGVYASPVAAEGRIYILGRDGNAVVLKHGAKFEVLAENTLDDRFDASPAIVGDELYLRGHEHLYAIVEAPPQEVEKKAAASR